MKKILLLFASFLFVSQLKAQTGDTPSLQYVFSIYAKCPSNYVVGQTQHGIRNIIPIEGGYFKGPGLKGVEMNGSVIPGGADYQMVDEKKGRTELEAIYSIKTDDGVNIHVRNKGILYSGKDESGNQTFYFRTAPVFEAPGDSKYDWLNNAIFVCVPAFDPEYIVLNMYIVQ